MNLPRLQSEVRLTERRKKAFALLALAVLLLLIYSNSFKASWHFDDFTNIVERADLHMTEFSWSQVKRSFFDREGDLYRPVACLSFALNHLFGGLDVFGYHLVNLLIHLAASLFLFLFLHQTLELPSIREKHGHHAYSLALLATVLWAGHPIQTQAVTYIVQRMASLAGLFYVMAMYFFVRARTADSRANACSWFAACLLSALLAFGSKQNAFVLPLSLLVYDQLISGRAFWARKRERRSLGLLLVLVTALLGLAYFQFAHGSILSALEGYEKRVFSLQERLLTQPRVLVFYLSLLIYPSPMRLSLVHDMTISKSLFVPISTFFSILFILAMIAGALHLARRRPLISFSILFFFINHVIESSIFPLELVFEHRNYIPSMLLFLPIAMLVVKGLDYFSYKTSMRLFFFGFVTLFLVGLGNATYLRNVTWRNGESLWMDCMDKNPRLWRPYLNLGKHYADTGQTKMALSTFKQGLGKRSISDLEILFYYRTYFNLGSIHLLLGNDQTALDYLSRATTYGIKDADQHILIASILVEREQYELAEAHMLRALADEPDQVDSLSNLGLLYLKLGRPQEAETMLLSALELAPEHAPTLSRLGLLHLRKKQYGRSFLYIERAIKSNPKDLLNRIHLACLHDLTLRPQKAAAILDSLLDHAPAKPLASVIDHLGSRHRRKGSMHVERRALSLLAEACKRSAHGYQKLAKSCMQTKRTLARKNALSRSTQDRDAVRAGSPMD